MKTKDIFAARTPRRAAGALVFGLVTLAAFAAVSAPAASEKPRCARSVHVWHPAPAADWIYGELVVERSTRGSYFAAIGFTGGYFGIQELVDGSKVALFSVWDPGDPFDFSARPDDVAEKLRTKNLYAGEGVTIKRFGGEGTGGQSRMPFDWTIGEPCRFAVSVRRDGVRRAAFTGYLYRDGAWFKMATFSTLATKGGASLRDVYSFIEDFRRDYASAQEVRAATFRNFFAKAGGAWLPLADGKFTGDKNPILTVDARVVPNGFALQTGGATTNAHVRLWSPMKTTVGERPSACCALDALRDERAENGRQ